MNSGFDINALLQEAQNRWLKPAEVLFILQNHGSLQLTEAPPQKPTSGSLFLFNKRVTRSFRKDGHNWRKKKTSRSVREGHERLKVGDVEALNCYYAHGEDNSNFQRRSFWMLDPEHDHITLVHYREVTERKQSAETVHLSPDRSSVLSTSLCTSENRCSISAISEPYQSSLFNSECVEFNSELLIRSDGINYMGETSRIGELISSPAANVNQALGRREEQLNLNGNELPEVSLYFEENNRLENSEVSNYGRISNRDELVAPQYTSNCIESHQFSGGNAGLSNYSNSSMFLLNPGGYTTESKEVPSWNALSEQCPGSCWIDPQDELFNTLDQIERGNSSANLAEQQRKWISQWLDPSRPGDTTEYMNTCHLTVQNNFEPQLSEARQCLLGSDNIVSSSATSLLQEVDYSKVSGHFSGTSTHGAVTDCYFDPINQLEVSLGKDSRFTLAQKQRFRIQEISPEWGYATEDTKVIIVGSFLSDLSECTWSCMFGEIEVPIQIIQEGVLCCHAPPHTPGKVTLCITSSNRESCSEVREFEYRSKPSICDNYSSLQRDANKHTEELLLLVRLVQMLLCDPLVFKEDSVKLGVNRVGLLKVDEDPWEHMFAAVLAETETQLSTKDCLLQELLREKLQHWLSSKYKEGDSSGCVLTKKEQCIIHLVAGLGFEWALNLTLKCGVSVNYRDINGWTALHWAARFGREKMVAALIAAGASAGAVTDPTSQDPVGKTPGSIAGTNGHKGLAGYLSEVALTSHLSSLTLAESEISGLELDRTVESISKGNVNSTDDSLQDSLAAVRNSAQAAARIQAFFRALSYKRRQEREAASAYCNEYGITPDEVATASKLAFSRFHNHMNKAALSIQKKYRGWKERQDFLALRQKIVMIQAHVRGYQVRRRYKVILWSVGVLDKIMLRWYHKRIGLRGFQPDSASINENEYEVILKVFRKLKVDQAVEQALSMVLSMVESQEARQQYRRILESYWHAKVSKNFRMHYSKDTLLSGQKGEKKLLSLLLMMRIFQPLDALDRLIWLTMQMKQPQLFMSLVTRDSIKNKRKGGVGVHRSEISAQPQ